MTLIYHSKDKPERIGSLLVTKEPPMQFQGDRVVHYHLDKKLGLYAIEYNPMVKV